MLKNRWFQLILLGILISIPMLTLIGTDPENVIYIGLYIVLLVLIQVLTIWRPKPKKK